MSLMPLKDVHTGACLFPDTSYCGEPQLRWSKPKIFITKTIRSVLEVNTFSEKFPNMKRIKQLKK